MGDYYGDFIKLEPCHYGCNDCGAEYHCVGEPRWCVVCQENIWEEEMKEYRGLRSLAHISTEGVT